MHLSSVTNDSICVTTPSNIHKGIEAIVQGATCSLGGVTVHTITHIPNSGTAAGSKLGSSDLLKDTGICVKISTFKKLY